VEGFQLKNNRTLGKKLLYISFLICFLVMLIASIGSIQSSSIGGNVVEHGIEKDGKYYIERNEKIKEISKGTWYINTFLYYSSYPLFILLGLSAIYIFIYLFLKGFSKK